MALKSQPQLKMTITDCKGAASVVGLALLDYLLYVVYKRSPYVLVYDTKNHCQVSVTSRHVLAAAAAVVVLSSCKQTMQCSAFDFG